MQEEDVRDFCRNKISRYKIPKYIFFVDEFPMTGQWQDSEIQTERSWFETLQGEGDRDYLNEE